MDAPNNSLADLSDPGWLGGVAVPQRLMSPITVDDRSSRPTRRLSASCGPTSLGYPLLQSGQVDQGVVGAHHAKDMRTDKLPGVLDKLLKPVPRSLRLFDRGQLWCAGLVFRELRADQVENQGHSFPDFDAVGLPGVSVLDQLVEVLLGINFKHYEPSRTSV